jgi:serine protease Do
MKQTILKLSAITFLFLFAFTSFAQQEKETAKEKKKDTEQIIITLKGDKKEKIVIEVDGEKVTVNGKNANDLKDEDIKVLRNKFKTFEGLNAYSIPRVGGNAFNFDWNNQNGVNLFSTTDENRAMLGVVTEKVEQGAKVNDVTEKSAAEKAGIKEGDIITKIGDKKIDSPDDLSEAVKKQKPGDKIDVTLLRDKKEQKVTAELGKWSGSNAFAIAPRMPDMNILRETLPRIQQGMPMAPNARGFRWSQENTPKLGLSVQDTEDGKGVKVIDVDEEGNAGKAGIKEDDIITHLNDKEVNSADEVAKLVKENKDKITVQFKIKRNGKAQTVEVRMPRKLKTAEL